MLALKLLLVPMFLLLVSLAGKRWGPAVAGWLAGLPVVTGPILFFLAAERGAGFASQAAALSLAAVLASVSFGAAYAHAAQRLAWPGALCLGLAAWTVAAFGLARLPVSAGGSPGVPLVVAVITLLLAPHVFPPARALPAPRRVTRVELACRMAAGALLTVGVTLAAAQLGPAWSGLLAVFPLLGIVLAVFSHHSQGSAYAAALLRAMATGFYSFVAFCCVLSVSLLPLGVAWAFVLASATSLSVQAATLRRFAAVRTQPAADRAT